MVERWRATYVEVHLPHLVHNFKLVKSCVPEAPLICAMVKADAYGHGDLEVAKSLERVGGVQFGVALVEEGVRLRRAGIVSPILVFGTFDHDSSEAAANFSLTPVLSTWAHVKSFENRLAEGDQYPIHLKFNTGMSRMGFEPDEAEALSSYFKTQERMKLAGVCTHLFNGEDFGVAGGHCEKQIQVFNKLLKNFDQKKVVTHYLNSSAIMTRPGLSVGARPGLALYGIMPSTHDKIRAHLIPVMTWKTSLALVRKLEPGATVSYGATWKAKRPSHIGLVPVGYGDGYPRLLSNKSYMLFRGRRVPVIGTICMDSIMLDLTDALSSGPPQAGEEVVIVGRQVEESIQVTELASLLGTNPYEIMTRVGPRVPRLYTH